MANLRKSIENGLSETKALEALTVTPAKTLGVSDMVGSLETGKLANFIITTGNVFNDKTSIVENWIQGNKYAVKSEKWTDLTGTYTLVVKSEKESKSFSLQVKSASSASIISTDTITTKFSHDGKQVKINFAPEKKSRNSYRLSGLNNAGVWNGYGEDVEGNKLTWTATQQATVAVEAKADTTTTTRKGPRTMGKVTYPFTSFGWVDAPKQEALLIKNATVWTNEQEGKL